MRIKNKIALRFLYALVLSSGDLSALAAEGDNATKANPQDLPLAVQVELRPRLDGYLKLRNEQLSVLAAKYGRVLDARLNKAADGGDLKTADAFRTEKASLETLQQVIGTVEKDSVVAVRAEPNLPELGAGSPEALVGLRKVWTVEQAKIMGKVDAMLKQSLTKLESDLTKKRDFDNAKAILTFRESLAGTRLNTVGAKAMEKKIEVVEPVKAGALTDSAIKVATKEKPFVNSLKMSFVPVKITGGSTRGRTVLFSVFETRVEDYEAFIRGDRDRVWPEATFKQRGDHPAVNVSWDDAQAFCLWLTKREHESGKLDKKEIYRLPTDFEWACAVGLGKNEDPDKPPVLEFSLNPGIYPWGGGFPPKGGVGNYYGEETKKEPFGNKPPIQGYDDGFERTAPVGSFNANSAGIHDMGGNVWEWCQDLYDPSKNDNRRVYRGASWRMFEEKRLRSSGRGSQPQTERHEAAGFRVVIARGRVEK